MSHDPTNPDVDAVLDGVDGYPIGSRGRMTLDEANQPPDIALEIENEILGSMGDDQRTRAER